MALKIAPVYIKRVVMAIVRLLKTTPSLDPFMVNICVQFGENPSMALACGIPTNFIWDHNIDKAKAEAFQ